MKMFTGRCQCGAIQYEMGRPVAAWLCHCLDCQRMTSSAYSFNMATPASTFRWTRGEPRSFQKMGENGRESTMLFCDRCGTWLATKSPIAPEALIVRVGTLDDHTWISPVGQAWTVSALPWAIVPGIRKIERDPTEQETNESVALWQALHPA